MRAAHGGATLLHTAGREAPCPPRPEPGPAASSACAASTPTPRRTGGPGGHGHDELAGRPNQAIADELVITLETVKSHVTRILDKLAAGNRTEAVARARELALIP
jgi:hypothetical protein